MRNGFLAVVAVITVFTSTRASAQPATATLVLAEGDVYLDDRPLAPAAAPVVLRDPLPVRTAKGRAVIALKRGGFLFLDEGASVRVLGNGVDNFNRIEVLAGSAIVASGTSAPLVACANDIRLSDAGMFRFDVPPVSPAGERSCRFRVFDGTAAVRLVSVTNALRAGQAMMCNRRCGDMIPTTEFPREQLDDFDQWARRIHERLRK